MKNETVQLLLVDISGQEHFIGGGNGPRKRCSKQPSVGRLWGVKQPG